MKDMDELVSRVGRTGRHDKPAGRVGILSVSGALSRRAAFGADELAPTRQR